MHHRSQDSSSHEGWLDGFEKNLKELVAKQRIAVSAAVDELETILFGTNVGEHEEVLISSLDVVPLIHQVNRFSMGLKDSVLRFLACYVQQSKRVSISKRIFSGNLVLATLENKFGFQAVLGYVTLIIKA